MLDNDLIKPLIPILQNGFASLNLIVLVKQMNQPTQQGANSAATIYFSKLNDHRHGTPENEDIYDDVNDVMIHTETQQYETMFQMNCLVQQNPADVNSLTASDVINYAAAILQSAATVAMLEANEVGIFRIADVKNPYFQNDKQQNEADPNFTFILTHKQVIIGNAPVTETVQINFNRV